MRSRPCCRPPIIRQKRLLYADAFPQSLPITSAQIVVEAPRTLDLQVRTLGAGLSDRIDAKIKIITADANQPDDLDSALRPE